MKVARFHEGPLFTSALPDWRTPPEVFEFAEDLFGPFDLDAAATAGDALVDCFLSESGDDAFSTEWGPSRTWLNPPYGRTLGKWVRRAIEQTRRYGGRTVLLLPARTETRWFADLWDEAAEVVFFRGRLRFLDRSGQMGVNAPFPSVLVMLEGRRLGGGPPRCRLIPRPPHSSREA